MSVDNYCKTLVSSEPFSGEQLHHLVTEACKYPAGSTQRKKNLTKIIRLITNKLWKENTAGASARNEILRTTERLGRSIWKTWSGYHRRSLVEAKMRCFKLLGERVNARLFNSQVAELQIRAALLNRFTQLGTPITVVAP